MSSIYTIDIHRCRNYAFELLLHGFLLQNFHGSPCFPQCSRYWTELLIIENVLLPIEMMSEKALEVRNKNLKKCRLNRTRKNLQSNKMEDLLRLLLVSSDPVITTLRKKFGQ